MAVDDLDKTALENAKRIVGNLARTPPDLTIAKEHPRVIREKEKRGASRRPPAF